jgi:adenylate cyclase
MRRSPAGAPATARPSSSTSASTQGDVIREEGNVFGGAVNIASRISALSAPGEVLVSRTVADLARTSAGVTFEDRGEHALKGVEEPQHVYAVRRK